MKTRFFKKFKLFSSSNINLSSSNPMSYLRLRILGRLHSLPRPLAHSRLFGYVATAIEKISMISYFADPPKHNAVSGLSATSGKNVATRVLWANPQPWVKFIHGLLVEQLFFIFFLRALAALKHGLIIHSTGLHCSPGYIFLHGFLNTTIVNVYVVLDCFAVLQKESAIQSTWVALKPSMDYYWRSPYYHELPLYCLGLLCRCQRGCTDVGHFSYFTNFDSYLPVFSNSHKSLQFMSHRTLFGRHRGQGPHSRYLALFVALVEYLCMIQWSHKSSIFMSPLAAWRSCSKARSLKSVGLPCGPRWTLSIDSW